MDSGTVFEVLMDAVQVCLMGQAATALFAALGQYLRAA